MTQQSAAEVASEFVRTQQKTAADVCRDWRETHGVQMDSNPNIVIAMPTAIALLVVKHVWPVACCMRPKHVKQIARMPLLWQRLPPLGAPFIPHDAPLSEQAVTDAIDAICDIARQLPQDSPDLPELMKAHVSWLVSVYQHLFEHDVRTSLRGRP